MSQNLAFSTDDIVKEYTANNWITAIIDINREVRKFWQQMVDSDEEPKAIYIDEWNEIFVAISDEHMENSEESILIFGIKTSWAYCSLYSISTSQQ